MPSQVIHEYAYDAGRERLVVTFTSGRRYAYDGVPPALFGEMRLAFAKGVFFNRRIRGRYPAVAITETAAADAGATGR